MTIVSATPPDLARAIAAFPEDVLLIRRLFLADRAFRSACEDYRLAREGLDAFARRQHDEPRPEIEEYQRLVRELEAELRDMINAVRGQA